MRLKVSLHTDVFTTYKTTWGVAFEGSLQPMVSGARTEKSHFIYGILGPVQTQDPIVYV